MNNTYTSYTAWGHTDTGKLRGHNEDRIHCDSGRCIFVVADGMGGEAAGEVAAGKAIDVVRRRLAHETGTVPRRLREAISAANNEIYRIAQENPRWRGMACVLTAAVIEDGIVHVGHVGDTRMYKIRAGGIRKLTPDHSPVGVREDAGELSEVEAMRHPRRNEVYRDVGSQLHKPDDDDFISYLQVPFESDAAILLCSDGLSDMLTSAEIMESVAINAGNPEAATRELIDRANAAGGKDNISAILVEGPRFAAAAQNAGRPTAQPGGWLTLLGMRWAFLCYGLAAGAVLAGLVYSRLASRPVPGPPVVPPRVLLVEPSSAEFPTIAKALEAARPGDRIEIARGEYEESIALKEGVDIAARIPGQATLRLTRPLPGIEAAVTAAGVGRAAVTGLVIKADPVAGLPIGIKILDSAVTLSDIEISGAQQAGVWIGGRSNATLAGSYIYSNAGPGLLVTGTSQPHLTGNVIYANGLTKGHPAPGLYVTSEANPEVRRNVFSGNGAEAIRVNRSGLRDRMMDNLFAGPGKGARAVVVEGTRP
jgi:PPM family protein phosphatase